jgi:biopolymer transport protein ExbD
MRLSRRTVKKARIEIIPMIDTIFFLLVFFMISKERLTANPELLVLINADERVEHGRVVDVMDDARQAGVAKMAIAVKPKDSRQ